MQHRTLGQDGFAVSEIGLGCWQFGGDFGPLEEATAMQIMQTAVAQGVNFFDTADVYGGGRSETFIGRFLQNSDTNVRIATKFGRNGDVYPDQYSEARLRQSVEGALGRLGVDTIDLLQLHCIPIEVLRAGDIFDWLRTIQAEGLIRRFGASVETEEQALLCLNVEGLQSLQIIFNILRQKFVTHVLPQAQAKGVGLIVRLPLASGLLAGKFTADTTFDASDHRNYNRDGAAFYVGETFAGLPFGKGVELTELLRPHVPAGMTMAQMAQRWILDHDAVSTVIPGASSVAQAQANAAVSGMPSLSAELHQTLSDIYQQSAHDFIRGLY